MAEFVGTALLLIAVVGSGIAAQTLSPSDIGLALLENAIATGAALVAIILAVGSVSGADLNPVVSCAGAIFRGLKLHELITYIVAQVAGTCAGVVVANLMFSLPAVTISSHMRSSSGLWLAEVVATFGLLLVIFGVTRGGRSEVAPFAVGAYITGAYFFTSSTSFANPAVTLARTLLDTFGVSPLRRWCRSFLPRWSAPRWHVASCAFSGQPRRIWARRSWCATSVRRQALE